MECMEDAVSSSCSSATKSYAACLVDLSCDGKSSACSSEAEEVNSQCTAEDGNAIAKCN